MGVMFRCICKSQVQELVYAPFIEPLPISCLTQMLNPPGRASRYNLSMCRATVMLFVEGVLALQRGDS